MKQFNIPNKQQLRAVMRTLGDTYEIVRAYINEYDEKGRVNNLERVEYINAIIQPIDDSLNTRPDGNGEWSEARYSITLINPDYIRKGEIIKHPVYGLLRVMTIVDDRKWGTMSGTLIATGSSQVILDEGDENI